MGSLFVTEVDTSKVTATCVFGVSKCTMVTRDGDERLCFRPCLYQRSAIFSTLRRGLLQSHVPGDRRSNIVWNSKALFRQIQESTMLSALQTGLTHFETV